MSKHALNRINERYGNRFSIGDINTLCAIIKKGNYLEVVKDLIANFSKSQVLNL